MCEGRCICKEHNSKIYSEIKKLIEKLDTKLSDLEFFDIKNKLMELMDELK